MHTALNAQHRSEQDFEMPVLNQAWFNKRFRAIRDASERMAEVELRALIREIHVAVRFREVKEMKKKLSPSASR